MTRKALIAYIIVCIVLGLFFYFVKGDMAGKACACTACPAMMIYFIYAYKKEKKSDQFAVDKDKNILSGSYFENSKWREEYIAYIYEHPFEKPIYPNMKKDLLSRFKRTRYLFAMIFLLVHMSLYCWFMTQNLFMGMIGFLLFGVFFYWETSLYIGMSVRRWLKSVKDYDTLERCYKNAKFLIYKNNGVAFGTTHIHAYTRENVYAIDYELVDGISRKVVRLKKYENGIYSSEQYQHFAVIHMKQPIRKKMYEIEIELNEFQVQMAIDYLYQYQLENTQEKHITVQQKTEDNTNVMI